MGKGKGGSVDGFEVDFGGNDNIRELVVMVAL